MSPFFLYNPSIFYRMGHDPVKANLCAPCRGVAADRKVRAIPRRGEGTPPCRWLRVHHPFQNALYGTVLTVPGRCNKIPQRHLAKSPLGSHPQGTPTPVPGQRVCTPAVHQNSTNSILVLYTFHCQFSRDANGKCYPLQCIIQREHGHIDRQQNHNDDAGQYTNDNRLQH